MAYKSTYDPYREADLSKQSARGRSIARRGRDIKEFRKSLPFTGDPKHPLTYRQKEYTYNPRWSDADSEQLRKRPGDDAKRGWFGELGRDASTMARDVTDLPVLREGKTMVKDLLIDPVKKYLPFTLGAIQRGLGSFGQNRIQNAENERILGDAYSEDVRKSMMSPSDRAFYEKYMRLADLTSDNEKAEKYRETAKTALRNAQITRRVNYALGDQPFGYDTSAEAGVAAFGADKPVVDYGTLSSRLQSGLEGTKGGREFLSDVIPKGEALMDTGMIGNAAARIAAAQDAGKAGFFTPEMMDVPVFESALPDAISLADAFDEPYGEEWDIDTSPYNLNPVVPISRQEGLDTSRREELMMSMYTDPEMGDPRYREGPNPFVTPYLPMEGPSPVDLPPYLSENTDWWTPEPEEKEIIPRGVEELIYDQYGVDSPKFPREFPRERRGPNTPPPGYGQPPWYSRAWDWIKEGDWPRH